MREVRENAHRGEASDSAGFTLVQLLLVLVGLSVLAGLSRPFVHRGIVNSRVEAVVGDVETIGEAAGRFRADRGEWPPQGTRGEIPAGLESYLPEGFTFRKPDYVLEFENWAWEPRAGFEVGVTFVVPDPELGRAIMDRLAEGVWSDGGSKYTWIFQE